ncbi:MAG: putative sulfate exporter family transporter [Rhodospirillaceae bacterium]|nr:putative sulfate exporter family transporter [Rhodospirillaceae bacterium]
MRSARATAKALAPGVLVSGTISLAATFLSDHYGGPVMLFALLLGMAFNFLSQEGRCVEGVGFTSRTVLRIGVALLGVRITVEGAVALGIAPILVAVAGVSLTLVFGGWLARRMGFSRDFGILTGGAVGICGASAALAIASVLPKGERGITERDTIFTVLGVTTLSTIAMVVYPLAVGALGLDDRIAGIFLGATIHDVAQVVGAGYSVSAEAGDTATLTKLLRVAMLVPVVLAITLVLFRGSGQSAKRPPFPLFLAVFVALVGANSLGWIAEPLRLVLIDVSRWALVAAIAALGIRTSLKDLASVGLRALVLLVAETAWIAGLAVAVLAISP